MISFYFTFLVLITCIYLWCDFKNNNTEKNNKTETNKFINYILQYIPHTSVAVMVEALMIIFALPIFGSMGLHDYIFHDIPLSEAFAFSKAECHII